MRKDSKEQPSDNLAFSGRTEGPFASGSEAEAVDLRGTTGAVYKPSGPVTQYFADQITIVARQPAAPPPAPPSPPPHFVDRESELQNLVGWLTAGESIASIALHGMGGIGKSALAKKLADAVKGDFSGGVLWTTLGTQPDVFHVLERWALSAGSDVRACTDVVDRATTVRMLLAAREKMLVVLDDVWEYECPYLLMHHALPAGTSVVLTTRDADLAKRLRCRVKNLDALTEADALALLEKLLGPLGDDLGIAREVARLLAYTPLALELAAGLADTPADLFDIARQLEKGPKLELLKMGRDERRHESVEASLSLSYTALSGEMQERFRSLGTFALAPFDAAAVATVWGMHTDTKALEETTKVLRFLTRYSLLSRQEDGLYSQHSLLRAYARALLERKGEMEAAARRHLTHYLAMVKESDWRTIEAAFPQIRQGWDAARAYAPEQVVDYLLALVPFLRSSGRWNDCVAWTTYALEHAPQAQDGRVKGQLLNEMGYVYWLWGRHRDALDCLQPALVFCRQANYRWGEGLSLNLIGLVHRAEGRLDEAMSHFQESLVIRREVGDLEGEGFCLQNIGLTHRLAGRYTEALGFLQRGLAAFEKDAHVEGQALCTANIGRVYRTLGRYDRALRFLERGLALSREAGDRTAEGEALDSIGDIYRFKGQYQRALNLYWQSFEIQREINSPVGQAYAIGDSGDVFFAQGKYDQAMNHYQGALKLWQSVDNPKREASSLNAIGCIYWKWGKTEQALNFLQRSLALHQQVDDLVGQGRALNHIGCVRLSVGDLDQAMDCFQQALSIAQETMTRPGEGVVLNNIGLVQASLRDYDLAFETFRYSLSIAQELEEQAAEGTVWWNVSSVYRKMDRQEEADSAEAKALEIARQLGCAYGDGQRRWFE